MNLSIISPIRADMQSVGRERSAIVYPSLPAGYDLGLVRIVGAGIGNCFFAYFHTVVIAKQANCRIIAPTWSSLRIGPLIRRERSLRRYGLMFRPHPDEIHGFAKVIRLACSWARHKRVQIRTDHHPCPAERGLTIVEAQEFTFKGLQPHRDMIRTRLLEILAQPLREKPSWGAGNYVAAHIRLGDFTKGKSTCLNQPFRDGERIPLLWYQHAIRRMRAIAPELPVHIFSDGHEAELSEVLAIGGVTLRREPNDIGDLLALAQARTLIGSNSTFARWATFLGDMPSIWPHTRVREQPSGVGTPILYITDNFEAITLEALSAE